MSGPNGVEIGRHIRNVMKNNITQIVYITAFDGYEQALFKVRPMDFLKNLLQDIERDKYCRNIISNYMNFCGKII